MKFAYELRRQDCEINWVNKAEGEKLDRFTKAFLKEHLRPEVLFDIIVSNEWSLHEQEMRPRDGYNFMITFGTEGQILTYLNPVGREKKKQVQEYPYLRKTPRKDHVSNFTFQLHPAGVMITTDKRRIVSAYGQVRGEQNDTHSLVIASKNHSFYSDVRASVWTLLPLKQGFMFFMKYAEIRPIMIARSSKFFWEKIALTANSNRYASDYNYFNIFCNYSQKPTPS